jgi:hypothetical protein
MVFLRTLNLPECFRQEQPWARSDDVASLLWLSDRPSSVLDLLSSSQITNNRAILTMLLIWHKYFVKVEIKLVFWKPFYNQTNKEQQQKHFSSLPVIPIHCGSENSWAGQPNRLVELETDSLYLGGLTEHAQWHDCMRREELWPLIVYEVIYKLKWYPYTGFELLLLLNLIPVQLITTPGNLSRAGSTLSLLVYNSLQVALCLQSFPYL